MKKTTNKHYIASVRNEEGKIQIIDDTTYSSKKHFADDLRRNGYKVRFISDVSKDEKQFDIDCFKYNMRHALITSSYEEVNETTTNELEEVETQSTNETTEEVDNTNILSVNVKEERDNKRINDVLQTVLTITYLITYTDGTTQTIQGYSEKNDNYEIYKTLPEEVKQFMHKRSHKYNTGEYKSISNCYWYVECEYININPKTPEVVEEAVEESLEEVSKKVTDINNVVARPINNTIALIEVNNNECTVIKSGFNDMFSAVNYHNEIRVFIEKSKCIEELKNKIDRLKDRIEEAEMLPLEYFDGDESCKIYDTIDKMKQQLKTLKKTYKHLIA